MMRQTRTPIDDSLVERKVKNVEEEEDNWGLNLRVEVLR